MKRIKDLWIEAGVQKPVSLQRECGAPVQQGCRHRVNILALGDVGMTVLLGLKLLGEDVVSSIGICDLSAENLQRLEMELNQIAYPFCGSQLPPVEPIETEQLFDCDVFVFCASKGVPPIGSQGDVRMAQLAANQEIIKTYGKMAADRSYQGLVAVVSDPVDPLCKAFLSASGLAPGQIQGYGLGVMNARALYFSKKDGRFFRYEKEGRAFGPHGEDLVIADSIDHYSDDLSRELTALTVGANLKVRELGYKPYIAPALSSAAISILLTLRGQWHYSSLYLGDEKNGAFLGIKNRMEEKGPVYEDIALPEALYARIKTAYDNLLKL